MSDSYDELFKILLIGDSGVGKSCLLLRYTEGSYTDSYISTIGVDFKTKLIEVNSKRIKLECWDTAGQERFQTITASYYRGAAGIILVYDITSRDSFTKLSLWKNEIDKYSGNKDLKIMVLGNKCDIENDRKVSTKEAEEFALSHGAKFLEVSAKQTINVEKAFTQLTQEILKTGEKTIKSSSLDLNSTKTKKKMCLI
eukprot:TRINITY_DN10724_c0_g1_i1.p1 TRINITY_DN10724_c0_g1~~TRINITY_DN10724_c0_g1_i1.p1  ORF type:complete len:198 (-),score=36.76 TRINITY_DN10724_c0_g1_i1:107-700(-)